MNTYKKLLRVPCVRLTIGVLVALVVVSVLSHIVNNLPPKVIAEELPTKAVAEVTEITMPQETRTYFDVPLSKEVQDHIFTECDKYGISPAVVVAMIERESNFNTYCIGDDGRSAGLMQIQAKWHIERMIALNATDLYDPCENITVGVHYLAEQLDIYLGDMEKALTAYNRGSYSGTVTRYAKEVMERAGEFNGN